MEFALVSECTLEPNAFPNQMMNFLILYEMFLSILDEMISNRTHQNNDMLFSRNELEFITSAFGTIF